MKRKKVMLGIAVLAAIVIGVAAWSSVKGQSIEGQVYQHLLENGEEISAVKDVIVKHSIKNALIFSNEWTIAVEYYDEPDVFYMYSYKDGAIAFAGIGGGEVMKDKTDYKHGEDAGGTGG